MRGFRYVALLILLFVAASLVYLYIVKVTSQCLTGAFLTDAPSPESIKDFKKAYGKKPFLVMVFTGWDDLVKEETIKDINAKNCALMVTWEPWDQVTKEAIDYNKLISGHYDGYIASFAERLKLSNEPVFIRFAHEANGNWYPWSGERIGKEKYIAVYRHVKNKFDEMKMINVKWVFSVNWEDVPKAGNNFALYYPGDKYVDFIGIDGYNWGNTKNWSKWISFKDIFDNRIKEAKRIFKKPVIISEFSSASGGGDKALWIKEALLYIRKTKNVAAFILFNVDKEADWSFSADTKWGKELKLQLEDSYFKDSGSL